jgi:hypothetical protein
MPACFFEQGGSQGRGGALATQSNGDTPMTRKKQGVELNGSEPAQSAIFDEVDTFEELAPRLHELSLKVPAGTRVYVRIRPMTERGTVH